MTPSDLLADHGDRLRAVGEALYDARAAFLGQHFEGYVADTYHVRDVGYVCWPALDDGRFAGYEETVPAEEQALDPLREAGFERVAVGLSRVVLRAPSGDHVVKLARCGMGDGFGDGRRENLVETGLSADVADDSPVVPSRHCEPRGTYAVYPYVDQRGPEAVNGRDHVGDRSTIRAWLGDRAPWLDAAEAVEPANCGVWRGRLRTLDYSFARGAGPLGVPAHVDHERLVAEVDRRRRAGEKRDLADGGGFVDPDLAGEEP